MVEKGKLEVACNLQGLIPGRRGAAPGADTVRVRTVYIVLRRSDVNRRAIGVPRQPVARWPRPRDGARWARRPQGPPEPSRCDGACVPSASRGAVSMTTARNRSREVRAASRRFVGTWPAARVCSVSLLSTAQQASMSSKTQPLVSARSRAASSFSPWVEGSARRAFPRDTGHPPAWTGAPAPRGSSTYGSSSSAARSPRGAPRSGGVSPRSGSGSPWGASLLASSWFSVMVTSETCWGRQ